MTTEPWAEPGTAEFDALLEAMQTAPETAPLLVPCSPQMIRWMLRGTFVEKDGTRARVVGGRVRGREVELMFRQEL